MSFTAPLYASAVPAAARASLQARQERAPAQAAQLASAHNARRQGRHVMVAASRPAPGFARTHSTPRSSRAAPIARASGSQATGTSGEPVLLQPGQGGIVITGGAAGVGFALAEGFAARGFDVLICDVEGEKVTKAAEVLTRRYQGAVHGMQCDVSDDKSVAELAQAARDLLPRVAVWINNAGVNGGRKPLLELSPATLRLVASVNLVGVLLGTQQAFSLMKGQGGPRAHVFNVVGSGCRGEATPGYAAYGATKRGLVQLLKTLCKELDNDPELKKGASVHNMSPGMVFTQLLLNDSTPSLRKFFDVLASEPEEVANDLVPKVLAVAATEKQGEFVQHLTPPLAASRLFKGFVLQQKPGRFDADGERVADGAQYGDNGVRDLLAGSE